jgi:hypothetical protein
MTHTDLSQNDELPSPGEPDAQQLDAQQPATRLPARQAAPDGQGPRAQFLGQEELQGIVGRWRDIQSGFVDEPRRAVMDADALVADLMQRLTRMFATEREELQSRWMAGDGASTEELRQGLRRYRSFFERLISV